MGDGVPAGGSGEASPGGESEEWRRILTVGHRPLRVAQALFDHLPSPPRCKMCHSPFAGVGGKVVGALGFSRSRKNPQLCRACCDRLPEGGATVDTAVLFADLRGSTAIGEHADAADFASLLNRFYGVATELLVRHDAIIDKLIGDEVMAFFVEGIAGDQYRRRSVEAAVELVRTVHDDGLPIGAAVHAGPAYVGNVGAHGIVDFTAVGDTVNVTSRLQGMAADGEVLVTDDLHRSVTPSFDGGVPSDVEVRGRSDHVKVIKLRT